jgi:hypothetical protein
LASLGESVAKNVILATTKWSDIKGDVGERREKEIYDKHWSEMLGLGSDVARFENNCQSAWDVVNLVLGKEPMDAILLQRLLNSHPDHPKTPFTIRRFFGYLFSRVSFFIKLEMSLLLTSPQ